MLIELRGLAASMPQLLLPAISALRVQPTHLLPAGMKITPYNHHCEGSFLPRSLSPQTNTTGSIEPSLLSNQSLLARVGISAADTMGVCFVSCTRLWYGRWSARA